MSTLSLGGVMDGAGRYAQPSGDTGTSDKAPQAPQTQLPSAVSGTSIVFAYSTANGDATTVYKIEQNATTVATITGTAASGVSSAIALTVAAGDYFSVEWDAGTQPDGSIFTIWIR